MEQKPPRPVASTEPNWAKEEQTLDLMLASLSRAALPIDAWDKVFAEAKGEQRLHKISTAFEAVSQGTRLRAAPVSVGAEFLFQGARFFADVLGDEPAAAEYLERALTLVPTHAAAFTKLADFLFKSGQPARLAELHVSAAQQRPRSQQAPLLRRAAELLLQHRGTEDKLVEVLQQILRIEPADELARGQLEEVLIQQGRFRDLVRLDEQALALGPPSDESREKILSRIVDVYSDKLQEPERALPFAEQLLLLEPTHERGREVARKLLVVKGLAVRAAAALAAAHEAFGSPEQVAHYLSLELEGTRGPKRAPLLARLGRLKEQRLGDDEGAFEAFEQALALNAEDPIRASYVALARKLERFVQASKALARAHAATKDASSRARTSVQLAEMLLRSGDAKRAKAALEGVLDSQETPPDAGLEAAYLLWEIVEAERDAGGVCNVLERIAALETDPPKRQRADERLSSLARDLNDMARAIPAFERLVETSARASALEALAPLYEARGDSAKYAWLLLERARDTSDAHQARALMMQAAEVRAKAGQVEEAIAAGRALVQRFGAASDVLALLTPLLMAQRRWQELGEALAQESELAPVEERAPVLSRLGLLKLQRLQDAPGAIAVLAQALAFDPVEKTARATLEKLAAHGEQRLAAGRALEPIYRRERASAPLLRVLEVRGSMAPEVDTRLEALREACDLLTGAGGAAEARAIDIVGRALRQATEHGRPLREWLRRLDEIAGSGSDAERRAGVLATAVGSLEAAIVTSRAALEHDPSDVATEAVLEDFYVQAERWSDLGSLLETRLERVRGDERRATRAKLAELSARYASPERARAHCELLIADPELTREQLAAVERAAARLGDVDLERAVLGRRIDLAAEPGERVAGLERLGELEYSRRGDASAALVSWRQAAAIAEEAGDDAAALRLHLRVRELAPSDAETIRRLLALAERAQRWGELPALYSALAHEVADGAERADLALRSARVRSEQLGDPQGAAEQAGRAFELAPERPDVLAVFERLSVAAGDVGSFERALGHRLAQLEPSARASPSGGVLLLLARARALGSDPGRGEDAANAYRQMLEDAGLDAATHGQAFIAFESLLARAAESPERRAHRRWLLEWGAQRGPADQRAQRTLAWAHEEEVAFADKDAALALYKRVLEMDPGCDEALSAVARLALATGNVDEALGVLRSRGALAEGPARMSIEREIARVLVGSAERWVEALPSLRQILADSPQDPESLALTSRLLGSAATRADAIALLEGACERVDVEARIRIVTDLLDSPATTQDAEKRRIWFGRVCDLERGQSRTGSAIAWASRATREMPDEAALWDRAEELARELARPDEVALAYQEVLGRALTAEQAAFVGERAVQFHEEWFEEPREVVRILERVLELNPRAGWAFDRLRLVLDAAERWDDLFALYDHALAAAVGDERSVLLADAAQSAKDFANQPERAIGYLEQLRVLLPEDSTLASSLERLYERQDKHRDLVDLLSARLPTLEGKDERRSRVRVASLWVDALGDPGEALDVLGPLLHEEGAPPEDVASEVWQLLERVLASCPPTRPRGESSAPPPGASKRARGRVRDSAAPAPASVRQRAASLLRKHYAAVGPETELARLLLVELEAVTRPAERLRRHVEVAEIYQRVGDLPIALEQMGLAVVAAPDDDALRTRLALLAERAGRNERLAEILVSSAAVAKAAALRVRLTIEAARLRTERLGDPPGAIALLSTVLTDRGASNEDVLVAARALESLLDTTGRVDEQVGALERIADVEPDAGARREALGKAARLAVEMGQDARAIALWDKRVAADEQDVEALDRLIELLEREQQHERMIQMLALRARAAKEPGSRRADLVRIAVVLKDVLDQSDASLSAWQAVEQEFGEAPDATGCLTELLGATGRWSELAERLERSVPRVAEAGARVAGLTELGDLYRQQLGNDEAALFAYARAIAQDAGHAGAREGLRGLASGEVHLAGRALEALLGALRESSDWPGVLELTPQRLLAASSNESKLAVLLEASQTAEQRVGDVERAFYAMRQAFCLSPEDPGVQGEVLRLAEASSGWEALAIAYREAIAGPARGDENLVAKLRYSLGTFLEIRLNDLPGALDAYLSVAPGEMDEKAACAAVRVAGRVARWDVAARLVADRTGARVSGRAALLDTLEQVAQETGSWDALTRALADGSSSLQGPEASDVFARLARWHRDRRGDDGAAEAVLERGLAGDPGNPQLLEPLVEILRLRPDGRLLKALVDLSEASAGDLGLLREACVVARDPVGDLVLARDLARRLLALATARWTQSVGNAAAAKAPGDAPAVAEWAIETLVALYEQAGDAPAVLEVLTTGEALAFDRPVRVHMRRRAARVALDRLADRDRAMALYAGLVEQDPRDSEAVAQLASIFAAAGMKRELLALRERQIAVTLDLEERTSLRLDAARLLLELEEIDPAMVILRANLRESPRHRATVEALASAMDANGRWDELCEILSAQAVLATADGDAAQAADLWSRAARVAEQALPDSGRAELCHAEVVALEPRPASLEALARAAQARGQHRQAAEWLEKWLAAAPEQIVAATLLLAQSLVADGQDEHAAARLEASLEIAPEAESLRERLADLYRAAGQWTRLAQSTALAAAHASDPAARKARLLEAAAIFSTRCDDPAQSVPLLEQASALAPQDASIRLSLSDALSRAGRHADASSILRAMIGAFGGRRPPERAPLHYRLARLELASGTRDRAIAELEAAVRIDPQSTEALGALAEIARDAGEWERAEKSYRALLGVLRRRRDPGSNSSSVAQSEVLLELRAIATLRGETERAKELLESALETASRNEAEEDRLSAALRSRADYDPLVRLLEGKMARLGDAAEGAAALTALIDILADEPGRSAQTLDLVVDAKRRAERTSDPDLARRLLLHVARIADKLGELALAAETFESLVRSDPADRAFWGPLLDLYRRRGDAQKLADLLARVIDYAEEITERGALRLERVRTMLEHLHLADAEAARLLGEILDEDAHRLEAAEMLAAILERMGDRSSLADLLARQVEAAKDRGDAASVSSLSLRLGALVEPTDRARARDAYYAGLDWEATNTKLLDALDRLLRGGDDVERADILERRLALEQGPAAEAMAMALWAMRADAGDLPAAERALAVGYRAYRTSTTLRDKLDQAYRSRAAWRELAELCVSDADARSGEGAEVPRLREAAAIYRTELGDASAAAQALGRARAAAPDDFGVLRELVDALVEAGDTTTAVSELGRTIDAPTEDLAAREVLVALRARMLERGT